MAVMIDTRNHVPGWGEVKSGYLRNALRGKPTYRVPVPLSNAVLPIQPADAFRIGVDEWFRTPGIAKVAVAELREKLLELGLIKPSSGCETSDRWMKRRS
jgi:hypothetical protein